MDANAHRVHDEGPSPRQVATPATLSLFSSVSGHGWPVTIRGKCCVLCAARQVTVFFKFVLKFRFCVENVHVFSPEN